MKTKFDLFDFTSFLPRLHKPSKKFHEKRIIYTLYFFRDGGKKEDRVNYAKFVIEMREAFEQESQDTGKPRLMITMAVPASLEYAGKGFDIATLDKHLDFFNLLTYDYHSAYEPATNHHSPLYRPKDWSDFDFRAELNIVSF